MRTIFIYGLDIVHLYILLLSTYEDEGLELFLARFPAESVRPTGRKKQWQTKRALDSFSSYFYFQLF